MLNVFHWRFTAQAAMRPDFIVFLSPRLDDRLGFLQRQKPMLVQTFIAEFSVEAFAECILDRLARINEMQLHLMSIRPFIQCVSSLCGGRPYKIRTHRG
jgi:hypothetical protein